MGKTYYIYLLLSIILIYLIYLIYTNYYKKYDYFIQENLINSPSGYILPTSVTGLKAWFDAADPLNTGVKPAVGTNISIWYDKSSLAKNTTGGSGNITFQNDGLPYLNFSNSFYSIPEMT